MRHIKLADFGSILVLVQESIVFAESSECLQIFFFQIKRKIITNSKYSRGRNQKFYTYHFEHWKFRVNMYLLGFSWFNQVYCEWKSANARNTRQIYITIEVFGMIEFFHFFHIKTLIKKIMFIIAIFVYIRCLFLKNQNKCLEKRDKQSSYTTT